MPPLFKAILEIDGIITEMLQCWKIKYL